MKRSASAAWRGGLKEGKGSISTESGILNSAQYGFNTRFEDGPGTNPEELIAAAHAGCFTMALSAQLGKAGITPERLETTAIVTLDKTGDDFTITEVHLVLLAKVSGTDRQTFDTIAAKAKLGCPVSKLLNARITLETTLEG